MNFYLYNTKIYDSVGYKIFISSFVEAMDFTDFPAMIYK